MSPDVPQSTVLAWNTNWFLPEAILAVESRGFSCLEIPNIAALKLAGRISRCKDSWVLIEPNKWVLGVLDHGYKLHWKRSSPSRNFNGWNPPTSEEGTKVLADEVEAMLQKGAILIRDSAQFVSGYFARPKPGTNKWRPIINLKRLNKYLRKISFRMDTVHKLRLWLREGYSMASIDLKDAYFSVPVAKDAYTFLGFSFEGIIYCFTCLCFGLSSAPRAFTKMLKPVLNFLRLAFCILISAYLDDMLLQAESAEKVFLHVQIAILVLSCLGYEVNFIKSSLVPSTRLEHLGFIFDTVKMTIEVPEAKMEKLISNAKKFLSENGLTLGDLGSFLGFVESLRPVVEVAPLHYRSLQKAKLSANKKELEEDYFIPLDAKMRQELKWWSKDVKLFSSSPLRPREISSQYQTDASKVLGAGWGGYKVQGGSVQGVWSDKERESHINVLELKAIYNTMEALLEPGEVAAVDSDNRSAVSYIKRMGGTRSSQLCDEALKLWDLVLSRDAWILPNWVAGKDNEKADLLSRSSILTWDFSLDPGVFRSLSRRWFLPSIDLFASKECHQIQQYVSWKPDGGAVTTDAFSMRHWPNKCYLFPPNPLLLKVVARLETESVEAILIAPVWPNALWYPRLLEMTVEGPLLLGNSRLILKDPRTDTIPAVKINPLAAFKVRGGGFRRKVSPLTQ